jgi:ankyrin repeat protein
VKYLKSVGADIHVKDKSGNTPLNVASLYRHLEVVKYLKSVGAR